MTDKLRDAEREAFEHALASKPDARFWNTADAMFWAWQARAALAQQDAQAELPIIRQNKLLADALASCILASGIVRTDIDGLTGPQLLLFAADLREMLETKKAQQDAQAVPPRTFVVMARRRLPSGRYSYTVESDVPLPIGAPLHTDPLNAAPTPPAQQDAQTGSPDHGELYAQGWLNGTQVQSLIDWCNSYPRKLPNVAFTEGTVRQVAYAIHNSLMLQQTKELAFAVDRLKKLVNLVYRGDYSKTETKEWWDHVEKMLKDTQAFCALPYEHLQDCAPDAAPTPPAQRVMLTDEDIREWWVSENGLEDCDMTKLDDFTKVVRAVIEAYERKNGKEAP